MRLKVVWMAAMISWCSLDLTASCKLAPSSVFRPAGDAAGHGFGGEDEAAAEISTFDVTFKPRRDLYSKGNEAALLLRDLSRLGEMSINCNMDDLPSLDDIDPEAAYFHWTIQIKAEKGEEGIRQAGVTEQEGANLAERATALGPERTDTPDIGLDLGGYRIQRPIDDLGR